jgi:hypothetical protein
MELEVQSSDKKNRKEKEKLVKLWTIFQKFYEDGYLE